MATTTSFTAQRIISLKNLGGGLNTRAVLPDTERDINLFRGATFVLEVITLNGTSPTLSVIVQTKLDNKWIDIVAFAGITSPAVYMANVNPSSHIAAMPIDITADISGSGIRYLLGTHLRLLYTLTGTTPNVLFHFHMILRA